MTLRLRPVLFAVLALCSAVAGRSAAEVSMSTLQELPVVTVSVRGVSPDGEGLGLVEAKLIEVVREPLAAAGVKVIAAELNEKTPGRPAVEITANVNKVGAKSYLYVLQLQLREDAKLVRKTKNLDAIPVVTWEAQKTGYTSKPEAVQADLVKLTEKFLEEWRSARRP